MFRHIRTLPLPASTIFKLQDNGFLYCEDLWSFTGSKKNLSELFKMGSSNFINTATCLTRSALDIWQEEIGVDRIVTFCQSIDDMLDGGFPLQSLTELCGAPGSGKTQLCLQLCAAVQIPRACGGLEGQALYIDTRNGFTACRLRDMVASCVSHCHLQGVKEFTVDKAMAGVHYIPAHDVIELMAALHLVHSFINKNDKVKLVVVDSLTFPFLHNSSNSLSKTRLLSLAVEKLHVIASQHNVSTLGGLLGRPVHSTLGLPGPLLTAFNGSSGGNLENPQHLCTHCNVPLVIALRSDDANLDP
uniref:DNA repair protein RAD51 homolog 3 n=1 Tax=Timema monikensis TaxID=170555 RepID=A0A7R9E7T1_9NEOP|nr:unnamed protein product [Timema monikensis]